MTSHYAEGIDWAAGHACGITREHTHVKRHVENILEVTVQPAIKTQ